jgi:hypothetical protein
MIELIYQTDPELYEAINNFGCNFRCHLAIAEIYLGRALTGEQINRAYDELTKDPDVLTENCVCGPKLHKIIDWAFKELNTDHKGRQVGIDNFNGLGPDYWVGSTHDYAIMKATTVYGNTHFKLCNHEFHPIWDPYPGTKMVQEEYRTLYKVF